MVRMSQGAHFLSDIVFAGVFMALTVLVLRALMLRGRVRAGPATAARPGPDPPP
jgi:membrane-associated PAP2 superfamily phosphatase